jgi:hypothetical protein
MRCHKTALSLMNKASAVRKFEHTLYAVASDVPYAGASVDDVVIIEPPHRPDRPKVYINETLKPLEHLRKSEYAGELNDRLREIIEIFTNKQN